MRDRIDVHDQKDRYRRALEGVKNDKQLSEFNRKKIIEFVADLQAENLTAARQTKYLYFLPKLAKLLKKDWNKATLADIKRLVGEVNQSKHAEWTKADCRMALKRFYRWIRHLEKGEDPPETRWIRIGGYNKRILPEELLTPEDIEKLIEACENSRDRAFVLAVSETGGRIAELLNLRRKHVQFDQYGALLMVSGKTGDRRVRIVASAPALSQWFENHPEHDNPEAPLWLVIGDKHHGQPLLYDSARFLLRRLAKVAGVKKRVNPQSFRHSRASLLANNLTERQMEQYLGWTPGSKMPKVYVHLSGRETDDAILRLHGMKKEEATKTPKLDVMFCPKSPPLPKARPPVIESKRDGKFMRYRVTAKWKKENQSLARIIAKVAVEEKTWTMNDKISKSGVPYLDQLRGKFHSQKAAQGLDVIIHLSALPDTLRYWGILLEIAKWRCEYPVTLTAEQWGDLPPDLRVVEQIGLMYVQKLSNALNNLVRAIVVDKLFAKWALKVLPTREHIDMLSVVNMFIEATGGENPLAKYTDFESDSKVDKALESIRD